MKTALLALLPYLLPLALTALSAGTGWVAVHLGALLRTKAQESRVAAALAVVNEFVMATVQDIEATEKAELLRAGDRALTADEGAKLKKLALERVKTDLSANGLDTLRRAVAALMGATPSLDGLLSGRVEMAVAKLSDAPLASPR